MATDKERIAALSQALRDLIKAIEEQAFVTSKTADARSALAKFGENP